MAGARVVRASVAAFAILLALAATWMLQGSTPADAAKPAPLRVEDLTPGNLRPVAPDAARAINRHQAVATIANPSALPFHPAFQGDAARMRSVDCLTQAIYYEAANEPDDGQRAVAQVVLNRVRHRAYPNSVCGVVYQGSERTTGCQFTFTCDGSLRRQPSASGWARARNVAQAALAGTVFAPVGYSTHYHADYVVPYWASSLTKTAVLGRHIFYRSDRRPAAFTARYAGVEPDVTPALVKLDPQPEAAAEEPQDYASATYIDFSTLAERPPEEKAAELDAYGLLAYKDKSAPPAVTADPATDAVIAAALAKPKAAAVAPAANPPAPAS